MLNARDGVLLPEAALQMAKLSCSEGGQVEHAHHLYTDHCQRDDGLRIFILDYKFSVTAG